MRRAAVYWVTILILVVLTLIAENYIVSALNQRFQSDQQLQVTQTLGALSSRIQSILTENLNLARGMSTAYALQPQMSLQQFDYLAHELTQNEDQLRNIAIMSGFTIKYVFPHEGNEAAIGLDLTTLPDQRAAAIAARDSGEMVVAGPIDLVQGGTGVVGRLPVFSHPEDHDMPGQFIGLVSAVIDFEQILTRSGLFDATEELDIALRGLNGSGANGEVFFGAPELFSGDAVATIIPVSRTGNWLIAARPKGGWATRAPQALTAHLSILAIGILLAAFVFMRYRHERRLVAYNRELEQAIQRRDESEAQLRKSEARYRDFTASMADWIWEVDARGRYTFASGMVEQILGYTPEELYGKSPFDFMPKEEAKRVSALFNRIVTEHAPIEQLENWNYTRDGRLVCLETTGVPIFDDAGQLCGYRGVDRDITERKKSEEELGLSHKIIESASEAILITDLNGRILDVNRAYERVTGYTKAEVLGKTPAVSKSGHHSRNFYKAMWASLAEHGHWEGEIWDRRKDNSVYPKWLSITRVLDARGEPTHYVGIFADISEKKQTEQRLENLAYYDGLTGLPNRTLFRDRMIQALAAANRRDGRVALLYIDLDRFKLVNDTLGHTAGDTLLQQVAARLRAHIRGNDTVARLGGDEFTVTLTDIAEPQEAAEVAERIIQELRDPFRVEEQVIHIGATVGIAIHPGDGDSYESLTRHADMAMYAAKDRGRDRYQFFSHELNVQALERMVLDDALHQALEQEQFTLYYQPKFHLEDGSLSGMESLIRWQHPEEGLVTPGAFIDYAEESGLIVPIGNWVLQQALHQFASWPAEASTNLCLAINLSARQFQQHDLVEQIDTLLKKYNIPAHNIELEITESTIMHSIDESIALMHRLRELGVSLAIDDFGVGYSSMNYLRRFPATTLKIDRSFTQGITEEHDTRAIVKTIILLAHHLDMEVVAEGVESEEQLACLREDGCDRVQGFLLGRPMSAEKFAQRFTSQSDLIP